MDWVEMTRGLHESIKRQQRLLNAAKHRGIRGQASSFYQLGLVIAERGFANIVHHCLATATVSLTGG